MGDCNTCIYSIVEKMFTSGSITDRDYWVGVLQGKIIPKPEFLQMVFNNLTKKIK